VEDYPKTLEGDLQVQYKEYESKMKDYR